MRRLRGGRLADGRAHAREEANGVAVSTTLFNTTVDCRILLSISCLKDCSGIGFGGFVAPAAEIGLPDRSLETVASVSVLIEHC